MSKMYICVLDEVPDFIVPCLVGHSVLRHHLARVSGVLPDPLYPVWLQDSFRKCVVSVSQKEYDKIKEMDNIVESHENSTLGGKPSCITVVVGDECPNVLRYASLWKPKV